MHAGWPAGWPGRLGRCHPASQYSFGSASVHPARLRHPRRGPIQFEPGRVRPRSVATGRFGRTLDGEDRFAGRPTGELPVFRAVRRRCASGQPLRQRGQLRSRSDVGVRQVRPERPSEPARRQAWYRFLHAGRLAVWWATRTCRYALRATILEPCLSSTSMASTARQRRSWAMACCAASCSTGCWTARCLRAASSGTCAARA